MSSKPMRIGIVVVAYNAAGTLANVLDRIPHSFRKRIAEILVCDDHSDDSTYLVGLGYQSIARDLPLTVIRNPRNLGYGGNQKSAYRLARQHGLDIVVLLHADGQYASELLPEMVAPLEAGECDAVFGSRMIVRGAARKGGMPLYKYAGNRILTAFENRMLQTDLSEFHSGYRAYRVDTLNELPLEGNVDGFGFDTQIIIQLVDAGKRVIEIPIPTYYGDEICYVNGLRYAREIAGETLRYRLGKMGFGRGANCLPLAGIDGADHAPYALKPSAASSHGYLLSRLAGMAPSKVLDLGCSSGLLAAELRKHGHVVVGVDVEEHDGIRDRVDRFVQADLDRGIPDSAGSGFDVVLAADVIEHVRRPEHLLRQALHKLRPGGVVLACIPNFGHWYPRVRTAVGLFDYDRRGILDYGHTRFFTRRSFERIAKAAGFRIRRRAVTGLPTDILQQRDRPFWRFVSKGDRLAARLRPQLFAYQLIYEMEATNPPPLPPLGHAFVGHSEPRSVGHSQVALK